MSPPPRSISLAAIIWAAGLAVVADGKAAPELSSVTVPAAAMVTLVPLPTSEGVSSVRFCRAVPPPKLIGQPVTQLVGFWKLSKLMPPAKACSLSELTSVNFDSRSWEMTKPAAKLAASPTAILRAANVSELAPIGAVGANLIAPGGAGAAVNMGWGAGGHSRPPSDPAPAAIVA